VFGSVGAGLAGTVAWAARRRGPAVAALAAVGGAVVAGSAQVLGGRVLFSGTPTVVALSNTWIVINAGGPTDDKPTVTLETPIDPDRAGSFLNFRVKDIEAVYAEWSETGRPLTGRRVCRPRGPGKGRDHRTRPRTLQEP
jgi:hypothetical protein